MIIGKITSFNFDKKIDFNTILNYLFLLYAFFVPTLTYANKAFIIPMFLLWILEGNFKYKYKLISSSKFIIVFLLFIIYNYISLFWTVQFDSALDYINKYKYYLPIIFIYTSMKKEFIKYSIFAFLSGMLISEIITYGIYLDMWSTPYNDTHFKGMPTAFMSHLAYSMFLAFTSLILINKLSFKNGYFKNALIVFYFLFVFVNLLISGGRTGLLSFAVTLLLYLIFYKSTIKSFIMSIVFFALLLSLSYNSIEIFKTRANQATQDINRIVNGNFKGSFGQRVGLIYVGIEVFKEKPILGWGVKDNFEAIKTIVVREDYKQFKHVYNVMNQHFHNQYIIYATQLGIVGLVLFLLIFYYLSRIKIANTEISRIRFLFIVVFMVSLVSTEFFHQLHPIGLFALFSGLFLSQNKYENSQ